MSLFATLPSVYQLRVTCWAPVMYRVLLFKSRNLKLARLELREHSSWLLHGRGVLGSNPALPLPSSETLPRVTFLSTSVSFIYKWGCWEGSRPGAAVREPEGAQQVLGEWLSHAECTDHRAMPQACCGPGLAATPASC